MLQDYEFCSNFVTKFKNEEKKDEKLERKKLKRRERAEKRQHKHMGISLRWFVTFLIIVLCAGIMLVYSLMSSRLYVQRYQEQLEKCDGAGGISEE